MASNKILAQQGKVYKNYSFKSQFLLHMSVGLKEATPVRGREDP
jgi:hypothetical protein